jgi:hypothetical protein
MTGDVHHFTAVSLACGRAATPRKRRRLAFTKRDLARAIAGHVQAGLSVQRVEIDQTGHIIIVTGQAEATDLAPLSAENEWNML